MGMEMFREVRRIGILILGLGLLSRKVIYNKERYTYLCEYICIVSCYFEEFIFKIRIFKVRSRF